MTVFGKEFGVADIVAAQARDPLLLTDSVVRLFIQELAGTIEANPGVLLTGFPTFSQWRDERTQRTIFSWSLEGKP